MNRITDKDLQAVCDHINRTTGNPLTPYTRTATGITANIGNYHLSHAYGGVELCQMQTDGGGVRDIFGCGHTTKRDLYGRMHAYLAGMSEQVNR